MYVIKHVCEMVPPLLTRNTFAVRQLLFKVKRNIFKCLFLWYWRTLTLKQKCVCVCMDGAVKFWEPLPSSHHPAVIMKYHCPEPARTVKQVYTIFHVYHLSDPADREKMAFTLALITTERSILCDLFLFFLTVSGLPDRHGPGK